MHQILYAMPWNKNEHMSCTYFIFKKNIFFWNSYFNIYLAREIYFDARLKNVGVTCLEFKWSVSSVLDSSRSCLLEGIEQRHPLFACFELKRTVSNLYKGSVSCLLERSEQRHPLFACLELKRCESCLIDSSEHQHPMLSCLEMTQSASTLLDCIVSCFLEES